MEGNDVKAISINKNTIDKVRYASLTHFKVPQSPLVRGDAVRQRGRGFWGLNTLSHKPDDLCVHGSLFKGDARGIEVYQIFAKVVLTYETNPYTIIISEKD